MACSNNLLAKSILWVFDELASGTFLVFPCILKLRSAMTIKAKEVVLLLQVPQSQILLLHTDASKNLSCFHLYLLDKLD
jgi:hypothetical protein